MWDSGRRALAEIPRLMCGKQNGTAPDDVPGRVGRNVRDGPLNRWCEPSRPRFSGKPRLKLRAGNILIAATYWRAGRKRHHQTGLAPPLTGQ
jgi:hypothetical protein